MNPTPTNDYRRLDTKLNAVLVVAGLTLLILVLALLGLIDLVT